MQRRLPLLIGLALVIGLGASCLHRAGPTERTDLPVYLAGAREVAAGRDPLGVKSGRGWPYIYAPTFAALMTPLTLVPQRAAAGAWYLLSLAALVGGVVAFRRLLEDEAAAREASPTRAEDEAPAREGPAFRWREDGIPLALILLPTASALLRGQVGPLLLGLFGLAALALARRRDVVAGLLIALATAIKLTPGLAIAGLVVARRWRAAAAACAGLVLWFVLVPIPFLGPTGTVRALGHFGQRMIVAPLTQPGTLAIAGTGDFSLPRNQAPGAQLLKRLEPGPERTVLLLALAVLSLGAALVVSARGEARPSVAAWALIAAAPLLALTLAWHHYHVLLYPGLALLTLRRRQAPLIAFALLSLLHFAVRPLRPLGLLGLGTLVVFGAVVWEALRALPREPVNPNGDATKT